MKTYRISFFKTLLFSICILLGLGFSFTKVSAEEYSTKYYTLSDGEGSYVDSLKLTITAKKGYKVYYTTGSDFTVKKFIKPGYSKTLRIKKSSTLKLYGSRKKIILTKKQLKSKKIKKSAKKISYSIITESGSYTTKDDVSLYLHHFQKLPSNFMTKSKARKLGWSGGGLDPYADGYCIGGDVFSNYEGNLPDGSYHECDIDTMHQSARGAKRLVYSDDGKIYYTEDHYDSFTQLYESWE